MRRILALICIITASSITLSAQNAKKKTIAQLSPFPVIPAHLPVDSLSMGNSRKFEEIRLKFPVTKGPFKPTWESIEKNYPVEPEWLRDANLASGYTSVLNLPVKVVTGIPETLQSGEQSKLKPSKEIWALIRSRLQGSTARLEPVQS